MYYHPMTREDLKKINDEIAQIEYLLSFLDSRNSFENKQIKNLIGRAFEIREILQAYYLKARKKKIGLQIL